MLENAGTIDQVTRATGLWPGVLSILKKSMESREWQDVWLEDGTFFKTLSGVRPLHSLFGVCDDEREQVLRPLAEYSELSMHDLLGLLDAQSEERRASVSKVIEWASALNVVRTKGDNIVIDFFVASHLISQPAVS